ncbi:hypothetical protein DV735_g5611, partial [Chaetothyriales sp. CBS 134920]
MADPATSAPLQPASIRAAHAKISQYLHRTPLVTSRTLSRIASSAHPEASLPIPKFNLYFKCENLQKIGAFKPRGAFHATVRLIETLGLDEVRRRGVVTHSSGNHAQALALAAHTFGIPAYIVMPRISTASKIAGTRAYTQHVIFSGSTSVEREEVVAKVQADTGAILVPPYDHPDIVLGQGTVALEMDEHRRRFDAVIAPIGGGGLLGGIATWYSDSPGTRVFGAEPSFQGADDAGRGVAQGKRIEAVKTLTIADGLRTPVGVVNWGIVSDRKNVEAFYSVTEDQIRSAMRLVFERIKLVVEPSGCDQVHLPLLSTLPADLQQSIQKYVRPADRLMSLASALLKYYFIHTQARIPWGQVRISRTPLPHGRPYWSPPPGWRSASQEGDAAAAGLEFNVTHQNGLVGLVGSGRGPSSTMTTQAQLDEWIDIFAEMFSARCRDEIRSAPAAAAPGTAAIIQARLRRFYALWALKEAYIKMVGEGLLAEWLTSLEFENDLKWTPGRLAVRDIRAVLDGRLVEGVQLALVAYEDDFLFATAMRGVVEPAGADTSWRRLDLGLDIRPCAEGRVVCVDRDLGLAEHTVGMIEQQTTGPTGPGAAAMAVQADVSVEADCKRVVDTALQRFGRVDILCNIVGIGGPPGNAVDVDMAQWARGMEVNVASMVMMAKYAIPAMLRNEIGNGEATTTTYRGCIVNMSSVAGIRGGTPSLLYPTSKGAVVNMTRAMAVHHAKDGIRVNCVCPGMVYTPMMYGAGGGMSAEAREARKNRSLLQVEGNGWDVGASVRFLAGDESRWITGECLVVDAGTTSGTSTQIPNSGAVGQPS